MASEIISFKTVSNSDVHIKVCFIFQSVFRGLESPTAYVKNTSVTPVVAPEEAEGNLINYLQ